MLLLLLLLLAFSEGFSPGSLFFAEKTLLLEEKSDAAGVGERKRAWNSRSRRTTIATATPPLTLTPPSPPVVYPIFVSYVPL